MTDLRVVLELVTDEIQTPPDLGRAALASALRRRNRRRGAVAAVAASVAIGGVIVVPRVLDATPDRTLPSERPTPTPTVGPSPPADDGIAPPISEDVVQRAWDPSTAADLPNYVIDDLPTDLVPGGSGSTPGDSTGALALTRSDSGELAILYGDDAWFDVEPPQNAGELWDSSLSRDGTRIAIVGESGFYWCPAAETGPSWTRVDVPERALGEGARITWTRDSSRLVLSSFETGYLVDLDSGEATELPYVDEFATFDVAPDGRIVARELEPRSVAEWDGPEQVTTAVLTGDVGGLNDIAVYEDAVAATRIDLSYSDPRAAADGDGLVVLERDGLATRAFLPFTGRSGQWVDGEHVKPVQWLNKLTVLVSVFVDDQVHLVTWDIHTGSKGHVASYPASYDVSLRDLYPA